MVATDSKKKLGDNSPIGKTLDGRYEIMSCLGAGGMGVVYKARQSQLDRIVAIKMPHQSALSNPSWRSRFEREARAMARFSHENIVSVFDFNITCERPYIVLEFVQGQELADFLSRPDRISMLGLAYVLRQIARGLDYAHQHSVIHRDIKPENIVIADARRRVKLMDFGLARFNDMNSEVTRAGFVVGTPHYMAPEQVRGKEVSGLTDVYAYAVILFCLFTGRLPFEGEGHSIMMKHASEEPPDPLMLNPFLPKQVGQALLQSLSKEPQLRHQTAIALVDDIVAGLGSKINLSYSAVLRGGPSGNEEAAVRDLWIEEDIVPPSGAKKPAGTMDSVPPSSDSLGSVYVAASEPKGGPLAAAFRISKYDTRLHDSAMASIRAVLRKPPHLLVVTDTLPDMGGAALCRLFAAHPNTQTLPIIYMGDRGKLAGGSIPGARNIQVLAAEEKPESVLDSAGVVFRKLRDVETRPFSHGAAKDGKDADAPLLSFLVRLDEAIQNEATLRALSRTLVRNDDLLTVFASIDDALRPILDYGCQACALLSDQRDQPGTVIFNMHDPGDEAVAESMVAKVTVGLRAASKDHKDFPRNFLPFFAKGWVTGEGSGEQAGNGNSDRSYFVPIEEGARLFGLYGVTHGGAAPNAEALASLQRLANPSFAAIAAAWRRRMLAESRERDEVTGTLRRKSIMEYFELSLKSTPALEAPFALMLLDIDKLDNFNETFGLEGGDYVLGQIGGLLDHLCTGMVRAGRVGNDEFMVVMPRTSSGEAMKFGKDLLKQIGELRLEKWQNPLPVSACAGVAIRAMEEKNTTYLMRAARNALMAAKAAGQGKIRASG